MKFDFFVGKTDRFDTWFSNNTFHLHCGLFYIEFSINPDSGPATATDDQSSDATADEGNPTVP